MTIEEKDPRILHLSYREGSSDGDENYKWLKVNIVFKVFDEHDIGLCDGEAAPWTKTYLYEVDDPEKITLHFAHTRIKWSKPNKEGNSTLQDWITDPQYDISDKKREGWQTNFCQLLTKIEKFNAYRYHDYVEDNPATRGALAMLEELKNQKANSSRFVPSSTLIRSLRTLDSYWD